MTEVLRNLTILPAKRLRFYNTSCEEFKKDDNLLPVRKIPKSYSNSTGLVATSKSERMTGFESRLEKYCQKLLDFNLNVKTYEEQPVKITYYDSTGRERHYTPDLLIHYRDDIEPVNCWRPVLAEVKYRSDLAKNWVDLKRKISAGRLYARKRRWDFALLTEKEIVGPYLDNAMFLIPYRQRLELDRMTPSILDYLEGRAEARVEDVINDLGSDFKQRAELTATLWRLVATYAVETDLEKKLVMSSLVRLPKKEFKYDEDIFSFREGYGRRVRWQALRYSKRP